MDLFLIRILSVLLCVIKKLVPLLVLDQLVVDFLLEVVDLFGLAVEILLLTRLLLLLFNLNLILQLFDLCLFLVLLGLFDENIF